MGETMTISDGLNTVLHVLQQHLRLSVWYDKCSLDLACVSGALIADGIRLLRRAMVMDREPDVTALERSWPHQWPWHELLNAGWGHSILGLFVSLSQVLRAAPRSDWGRLHLDCSKDAPDDCVVVESRCDWSGPTASLL